MLVFPLPDSLVTAKLSRTVADLRDRISVTSQEAVTGRYSDLTEHLGGRIGSAMLSRKALDDIGLDRTRLSLRENRLDILQRSLSTVQNRTIGLDARMQTALGLGDAYSITGVARDAVAALEDIFAALNVRHTERFLFSGDATSTPPFGSVTDLLSEVEQIATNATDASDFSTAIDTYFDTSGGGFQQNTYNGTPTSSDAESVTGIDPALLAVMKGLAVMAVVGATENLLPEAESTQILKSASETLSSGQTALTTLRADRGLDQARIEHQKATLDVEETILTAQFNQLTARDQYEAASDLRQLESTLEASYLLTSRLSNLSLLNYLR